MRALAWEFPNEPYLASADRHFMLGDSLLIIPVLEPNAEAVSGVFPGESTGTIWYDWYNHSAITDSLAKSGANFTIPAPLSHVPVFVRGGGVLPMQPLQDALTIKEAQTHDWAVLIGLDHTGEASGSLYLDDAGTFVNKLPLTNVTVIGVRQWPTKVLFNDKNVDSSYDDIRQLLEIRNLPNVTFSRAWGQNWQLTWSSKPMIELLDSVRSLALERSYGTRKCI
ncbi:hypothetical protein M433DRAFT_338024 [Acidomyces richmondensis BFW]|nr:hypothetical protein M433DRAFT_338024 [Acidomyces richmondensis BFW]